MGKFDGFLFCSDLDGTLFNDNRVVPERNLRAIDMFIREGGRFTVCTGRSKQTFQYLLDTLKINAPAVLANGAFIYDFAADKVLHTTCLPDEAAELCRKAFDLFPQSALEAHTEKTIYLYRCNKYSDHHEMMTYFKSNQVPSIDKMPLPWLKALFVGPLEELNAITQWIEQEYPGMYGVFLSHPMLLELQSTTANKGEGVAWLADYLNIQHEKVFVAGDFDNDLSMLTRFNSFSPDNAPEHIKAQAERTVCSNNDGTIADIIEYLDRMDD